MREILLQVLCCPACGGAFSARADERDQTDIIEGALTCSECRIEIPIRSGIPRFVSDDSYATSFGLQWQLFAREQLDRYNGRKLSLKRLRGETRWNLEELDDEWILDAGCGSGRFLDVLADKECNIVGVDVSAAVDAAYRNVAVSHPNVHLVQADLFSLPFRGGSFDRLYCIGVAQHTPSPQRLLRALPAVVKAGGHIAVTCYERKPFTRLNGKYLLRPLTTRMNASTLLRMVQMAMPVLLPITTILFRLPVIGRLFRFVIPVANYVDEPELDRALRYRWALLDTFDMLAPRYDQPLTEEEVRRSLEEAGVDDLVRLPNPGVNVVARAGV